MNAIDYLLKPFKLNALLSTLNRALDVRRLRMENVHLRELVYIYELGRQVAARLDIDGILRQTAGTVMTPAPRTIRPDALAVEALNLMNERSITACS